MSHAKGFFCSMVCLILWLADSSAQEGLDRLVSIQVRHQTIEQVLTDIEDRYQIFFTYSKNFIPVDQQVNLHFVESPLEKVLEEMFRETAVAFVERRGKIILKIDPVKEEALQQRRLYEELRRRQEALLSARQQEKERMKTEPLARKTTRFLDRPGQGAHLVVDWEKYRLPPLPKETSGHQLDPLPDMGPERKVGQISVLPFLGTNALESDEITNRLSFNVFWGWNGGLDGLEVGLFFNSIKNQMEGVQLAGMGNAVGGEMEGVQVAGLFNVVLGAAKGYQGAGLFNVSPDVFSGVQTAGLFNFANETRSAVQVAGLMNISGGEVKTQFAGFLNAAKKVKGLQFSTLLNVAGHVEGAQIGLINVADSISGVPIGLLNFIKNGYNRVEFSANETFLGNFALRIGVRKFYNILIVGGRIDGGGWSGSPPTREVSFSWGLGYGIGKGLTIGSRNNMLCLEALLMHVNERQFWTRSMNLWNQYRIGFDFQTGRRTSVFFGPTMNILFSELYNEDTNTIGSNIMPYTFYDRTREQMNVKMWAGFGLGVRF